MAFKGDGGIRTYSRKKTVIKPKLLSDSDLAFEKLLQPSNGLGASEKSENVPSSGSFLAAEKSASSITRNSSATLSDISNRSCKPSSPYSFSSSTDSIEKKKTDRGKRRSRKKKNSKNDAASSVQLIPPVVISNPETTSASETNRSINCNRITYRRKKSILNLLKPPLNHSTTSSNFASNESSGSSNHSQRYEDAAGKESDSHKSCTSCSSLNHERKSCPSSPIVSTRGSQIGVNEARGCVQNPKETVSKINRLTFNNQLSASDSSFHGSELPLDSTLSNTSEVKTSEPEGKNSSRANRKGSSVKSIKNSISDSSLMKTDSNISNSFNSGLRLDTDSLEADLSLSVQALRISCSTAKSSSISAVSTPNKTDSSSDSHSAASPIDIDISPVVPCGDPNIIVSTSISSCSPAGDKETTKLMIKTLSTCNHLNNCSLNSSRNCSDAHTHSSADTINSSESINSPIESFDSSSSSSNLKSYSDRVITSDGNKTEDLSDEGKANFCSENEVLESTVNVNTEDQLQDTFAITKEENISHHNDLEVSASICCKAEESELLSLCDETSVKILRAPVEADQSFVLPQGLSKDPFKKPFIKPLLKREANYHFSENTLILNSSNARFSVVRAPKSGLANLTILENSVAGDESFLLRGSNAALILERGKNWRRSFLKARRETHRLDVSIAPNHGFEKVDEEDTHCEVSRSEVPLTLNDLLVKVPAKKFALLRCEQREPIHFSEMFPEKSLVNCIKVGEGVFGEVFLLGKEENHSIIKIIPIEGDLIVNDEPQKTYAQVLSEIITAQELSNLRNNSTNQTSNFCKVLSCKCVYGQYPAQLIKQWDAYHSKTGSYNDSPVIFGEDQLYIVLKLGNAGKDLECYQFTSSFQSYSALLQIGMALAVAERSLDFEHRDLHWGNVLLSPTKQQKISFKLDNEEYSIPTHGVKATIIDFTLSRMSLNVNGKSYVVSYDLGSDPELFQSHGDYQFNIYRMMKDEVEDVWHSFKPKNNIFWMHYIVDKMMKECHYKNIKSAAHAKHMTSLEEIHRSILDCSDCCNFVTSYLEVYGKSSPADS